MYRFKKLAKYYLGIDPKVRLNRNRNKRYVPKGYDAVVTVSADFELAWAWQHAKGFSREESEKKANTARSNIKTILELCEEFNIPITWYTVGHLFLRECNKVDGTKHRDIERIDFFENEYWEYNNGDWFDNDPCGNYKEDEQWYAPDIIDYILRNEIKHEIGCHTFSHINCDESICSKESMRSELNKCKKLAKKFDLDLKSFVYPGHVVGNLDVVKECGFTSYRDNSNPSISLPEYDELELWKLTNTYPLHYDERICDLQIKLINKIIDEALNNKANANFWFHPSSDHKTFTVLMKHLFEKINNTDNRIYINTIGGYIEYLNSIN